MNLSNEVKMTRVADAAAAAQTEVDSTILDMAGFDGVMFVAMLNAVSAGCVLTLTAQENSQNQSGGMAAIVDGISGGNAAASVTDVGGASSNGMLVVDVFRPLQEFVRAAFTRTTANAALDGIIALQYKSKKKPTVQDASVLAKAFAVGS